MSLHLVEDMSQKIEDMSQKVEDMSQKIEDMSQKIEDMSQKIEIGYGAHMEQIETRAHTIPSLLATDKPGSRNRKFVLGGSLILVLVIFMIIQATAATGAYFMTVSELFESAPEIYGQRVRVNGAVVDGSEDWNAKEITLKFAIEDEDGQELPIIFYGPRPDNFPRAVSAIVEGELLADGSFKADTLLLKCPSRYEEEPEEVFVQSTR